VDWYIGVISGALLQLRTEFSLNCQQTELVVSALLLGALIASLFGGQSLYLCPCLSVSVSSVRSRSQVSEVGQKCRMILVKGQKSFD